MASRVQIVVDLELERCEIIAGDTSTAIAGARGPRSAERDVRGQVDDKQEGGGVRDGHGHFNGVAGRSPRHGVCGG